MTAVRAAVQARSRIELPDMQTVDHLDRDALVELATQAAALHARAMARLALIRSGPDNGDSYLTPDEAATLLRVSKAWVCRHAAGWGFATKLGHKVVRIDRAGLLRWMAQRQRR